MAHNHGNHKLVLCQECDLVYCKGHCERTWGQHHAGFQFQPFYPYWSTLPRDGAGDYIPFPNTTTSAGTTAGWDIVDKLEHAHEHN